MTALVTALACSLALGTGRSGPRNRRPDGENREFGRALHFHGAQPVVPTPPWRSTLAIRTTTLRHSLDVIGDVKRDEFRYPPEVALVALGPAVAGSSGATPWQRKVEVKMSYLERTAWKAKCETRTRQRRGETPINCALKRGPTRRRRDEFHQNQRGRLFAPSQCYFFN